MVSRSSPGAPVYVDSSVLVALLAPDDRHYQSIRRWVARDRSPLLSSVLAEVEVGRSLRRRGAPAALQEAFRRILSRLDLVEVTASIRAAATEVRPTTVRSLDAIHIGTALIAGVERFASLDARQRMAAEEMGLELVPVRA